jgi:hypothetical protein
MLTNVNSARVNLEPVPNAFIMDNRPSYFSPKTNPFGISCDLWEAYEQRKAERAA